MKRQVRHPAASEPMDGRVCLVTGATSGMGKVIATELARRGATVALCARDRTKGERVRREIMALTGSQLVDLFVGDLAEFADVRRLAAEVQRRYPALHVLVNNAGAFDIEHRLNADGVEMNLAVNFFSPFLLSNLLAGALVAGAPSRVVNVGSAAMATRLDLDHLSSGRQPVGVQGYASAKLALLMASYALARRMANSGVTVNVLHPGVTATGIGDAAAPRLLRPLVRFAKAVAVKLSLVSTPEQGAQSAIYLATSPQLATVTGKYYVNQREQPSPPVSYSTELQERLWQLSGQVVGLAPEEAGTHLLAAGAAAMPPMPEKGRSPMPKFLARIGTSLQTFLYRLSAGRILGEAIGVKFLLLTTTGRKSGKVHTTPLGYFDDGDGYVIAASYAGNPRNPGWYYNLRAEPHATIQVRGRVMAVVAEEATGERRRLLWDRRIALTPAWAKYTERTEREFPMLILRPAEKV